MDVRKVAARLTDLAFFENKSINKAFLKRF